MSVCDGLRVVELAQGMAGPLAGMVLADYGADVVKVEPPAGDWARARPGFLMWNRGKRSVVADLRTEAGRQDVRDLLAAADIAIVSWRPGVAERLGLDYESAAAVNPRLVYADVTGFGDIEQFAGVQGYEGVVAAAIGKMSGLDLLSGAAVNHDPEEPLFTAAPVNSYAAANSVVQGTLAALLVRDQSGVGQRVGTSLVHGASAGSMRYAFSRDASPEFFEERELRHRGTMVTFMTVECADGKYIQMCARQDHHFRNWMTAIGLPDVLDEPRYKGAPMGFLSFDDIYELEERIRKHMLLRTQEDWMRVFVDEVDVGADPFLTPAEFLEHEQLVLNDRVVEVTSGDGITSKQLGALAHMTETPPSVRHGAPALGEHTGTVRWSATTSPRAEPSPSGATRPAPTDVSEHGPLHGVTILEVAGYLAGPLGATLVAELGARVVKVEPLTGDSFRRAGLEFVHLAHGKESIALDLKNPASAKVLRELVARADILLHNFRPGVPERLGFGYETVREINPRLVYVYAGSYGTKGPQSHRAAMHSTPNALNGGGIIQAGEGNPPVDDSYPDPTSGVGVATAMLLGLYAQRRTGLGQYVETSMLVSSGYVHSDECVIYPGRPPMAVSDNLQRGPYATYRLYKCDPGWLFLSIVQDSEWARFVDAVGVPGWPADERFATVAGRLENDAELTAGLERLFATANAPEMVRILQAADVPVALVKSGANFETALVDLGFMEPAEHPAYGRYWKHPPCIEFSQATAAVRPPCGLGEHTVAILGELGYGPDDVQRLLDAGAIGIGDFGKKGETR